MRRIIVFLKKHLFTVFMSSLCFYWEYVKPNKNVKYIAWLPNFYCNLCLTFFSKCNFPCHFIQTFLALLLFLLAGIGIAVIGVADAYYSSLWVFASVHFLIELTEQFRRSTTPKPFEVARGFHCDTGPTAIFEYPIAWCVRCTKARFALHTRDWKNKH